MEAVILDEDRLYRMHEWIRPLEKQKAAIIKHKIIKSLGISHSTYYNYYSRRSTQRANIPFVHVEQIVSIIRLFRPNEAEITVENFINKASCSKVS